MIVSLPALASPRRQTTSYGCRTRWRFVPAGIARLITDPMNTDPLSLAISMHHENSSIFDTRGRTIRILTFSTLFPNAERPSHGIFVENRLRQLLRTQPVEARVVAPVPWFPRLPDAIAAKAGRYAVYSRIPARETRWDIDVLHPRYLTIPKVGTIAAPFLLAARVLPLLQSIRASGFDFDLIDAHYYYPDGVAAWLIARALSKPFVVTARGSDIYVFPKHPIARRLITAAARAAAASISVSSALRTKMMSLGLPGERIRVLRNGVDLEAFQVHDREAMRRKYSLNANGISRWISSVGHLIPPKGHDLVIKAAARLPGLGVAIAGDGPEAHNLRELTAQLGMTERVRFMGVLSQPEINELMSASDAMVLASKQEGWANVLLESMASGTPVIASDIEGTREVVLSEDAGLLVTRTPEAIASGVTRLFGNYPARSRTRKYAEGFSWTETSRGQYELFQSILSRSLVETVSTT